MIEKCIRRLQVVKRLFDLFENELEDLTIDAGNIIIDGCVSEKGLEQSRDIVQTINWLEGNMADIKESLDHIETLGILQ